MSIKDLFSRLQDDRGVGMVTALGISLTVLALSATWYSVAVHEIEESSFDEHRTMAVNAVDAGLREAMHRLANEQSFRDDAETTAGATADITSGECVLVPISSNVDGVPTQLGEYWYRAVKLDPDPLDLRYLITAWGWSPSHDRAQSVARQATMEVELIPLGGFFHALFAADGGINAGNRKEIYGDIYTGQDLTLDNYTRVYPNDSGYFGTGSVNVFGDLVITSGSNVEAWGDVRVNGYIDDSKPGSHYLGDVMALHDNPSSPFTGTHFQNATVDGTFFTAGSAASVTGTLTAGTEVYDATGLTPVVDIGVPTFTWNPADYSPAGITHASWADFDAWYSANSGALGGAHYVTDTGSFTLDLFGAYLVDDFVLATDGDLTVKSTPSGSSMAPATIVLVGADSNSKITLAQSANSIEDVVHHLIVSLGEFAVSQQTTIYGAMYGDEDTSTNRLEIHFRPPSDDSTVGFAFDPALADSFMPQPWTWREVPAGVDDTGIQNGASYFCTYP